MPEETQTVILTIPSCFGVQLNQQRHHYLLLLWATSVNFQAALAFFFFSLSLSPAFLKSFNIQWPLFPKQSHEKNFFNCPGEITYSFFPTLPYTTLWSFWNKTLRFTNLETWNVHNSVKYKDIAVCVYENFRIIHLVKSLMNQWLWFWKAWCLGIYFQNNMTPKPLERKLGTIRLLSKSI